jgi:endonuclease G
MESEQQLVGDVPRYQGTFKSDTLIPDTFYRVKHSDYTNSGYNRGHIVRSEERTKTEADNLATFYLTMFSRRLRI